MAKRVRADMAAGVPEKRAHEAAEKEARYAAFLKSRTAADLARSDEILGLLCSTDGRLPLSAVARMCTLAKGGANPRKPRAHSRRARLAGNSSHQHHRRYPMPNTVPASVPALPNAMLIPFPPSCG